MAKFKPLKKEELNDLGFGRKVSEESHLRLLNRDGTFNVARTGLPFWQRLHLYHNLLSMPWWRFYLTIAAFFVSINIFFGALYILFDVSISGSQAANSVQRFMDSFFFSIQTFTSVGYGRLSPSSLGANLIASLDALVGLMSFALATGLLFARFSRPTINIVFSRKALIAPYRGISAFEFRLANGRNNQLVDVEVKLLLSKMIGKGDDRKRTFFRLALEREKVIFLPLHWIVVHPIEEESPLHGISAEDLQASDAEFLVLLTAFDETFSQTVHARASYKWHEIVWGAKFSNMFRDTENGILRVDLKTLHDFELIEN